MQARLQKHFEGNNPIPSVCNLPTPYLTEKASALLKERSKHKKATIDPKPNTHQKSGKSCLLVLNILLLHFASDF